MLLICTNEFLNNVLLGKPPGKTHPEAASTSADGRFTPVVSNLLTEGILVPYIRH